MYSIEYIRGNTNKWVVLNNKGVRMFSGTLNNCKRWVSKHKCK